jgi:hypothetical protein
VSPPIAKLHFVGYHASSKGAIMSEVSVAGWERALMAAENVKDRLRRATRALEGAAVPYAVVGGNAVAEWVARLDDEAVRNTRAVDVLVRRADFGAARSALEAAGFVYQHVLDVDVFLDGPQGKPSGGVHLLFAGEKVRAEDEHPCPDVEESERASEFQVVTLLALVRMKLMSWRDKDRTHLRDMIQVGLLDSTWPARLPPLLASRLQQLLDNPRG